MALTTRISVAIVTALTGTTDLSRPEDKLRWVTEETWGDGSGAQQANKVFADRRPLAGSATDTLDLNGVLVDALGVTYSITKLKGVGVKALSSNAGDIALQRPAANGVPLFSAAGDQIVINPGGLFLWESPSAAGVPVTAATADLLAVVNLVASACNYEVVLIGA